GFVSSFYRRRVVCTGRTFDRGCMSGTRTSGPRFVRWYLRRARRMPNRARSCTRTSQMSPLLLACAVLIGLLAPVAAGFGGGLDLGGGGWHFVAYQGLWTMLRMGVVVSCLRVALLSTILAGIIILPLVLGLRVLHPRALAVGEICLVVPFLFSPAL